MSARSIAGRLLPLLLPLLSLSVVKADSPTGPLAEREEWKAARKVWGEMDEHSTGRIVNRREFALLKSDLDRTKEGLGKLAEEKLLPGEAADRLEELFQARYDYLAESRYPATPTISLSGLAFVRAGTFARFEFFLSAWRERAWKGEQAERLLAQAKEAVIQQLEMLEQTRAMDSEIAQEEKALREKEEQGKKVDWTRARLRWSNKTLGLVRGFQAGRQLRISSETRRLSEFVFALSEQKS